MDGSVRGRGGVALRMPVRDKGRALPLAWRVRQGPKGHLPEALPSALGELIGAGLPAGSRVVLRGDGECAGTTLQETRTQAGWSSAGRTAQSTVAPGDGATLRLDTLGACRKPGTLSECKEGQLPRAAYGPVMVLSGWAQGYHEPWYVVSTMATAEEACRYDQKRFRIEPFFADQTSRGF